MFVEMVLGLKDVPGMLVKALEPVSSKGGNIVSVIHSRGKADVVEVTVAFKVKDDETLGSILAALKREDIAYREVNVEGHRYYSKKSVTFIFIGHVIDRDMQDTIDEINRTGLVRGIDVRMSNPDEESSVLLRVNVDESKMKRLIESIHDICRRKKFLYVSEVMS